MLSFTDHMNSTLYLQNTLIKTLWPQLTASDHLASLDQRSEEKDNDQAATLSCLLSKVFSLCGYSGIYFCGGWFFVLE
jgi:hypothetical protein